MSDLIAHAQRELERAGMFATDADYGGTIGSQVMELIEAFARQGHSGGSAAVTLGLFDKLTRFDVLGPITSDPDDWMDVRGFSGTSMWQSRRKPSVSSKDGGQTWYDLDQPKSTEEQPP